jgi:K+-sensing histidine kinase KdpD
MERILVCMDDRRGAWEALSHSVCLAKRIGAAVHVLRIQAPGAEPRDGDAVRSRLERQIEAAKAEGVNITHFVAEGPFEEEVIRFAEHHRISLLVAEPGQGEGLQQIRHRIACRVELVSPRRNPETTDARGRNT